MARSQAPTWEPGNEVMITHPNDNSHGFQFLAIFVAVQQHLEVFMSGKDETGQGKITCENYTNFAMWNTILTSLWIKKGGFVKWKLHNLKLVKHGQQQIFKCSTLSWLLSFQNFSPSSFWLLTVRKNGGEKHLSCNDILGRQCCGSQTEIMYFTCTNRRGSLSQIVEATYHSDTRNK